MASSTESIMKWLPKAAPNARAMPTSMPIATMGGANDRSDRQQGNRQAAFENDRFRHQLLWVRPCMGHTGTTAGVESSLIDGTKSVTCLKS